MKKVAWIGAGVMGRPMAGHLQAHGFDVSVYARKPEVLETMKTQYGIEKCYSTIKEAVADAEVVFVMVGYPKDVEEVFLSDDGIFANVKPGTYVVDMTTSSPSLAVRLYELGKEKDLHVMDAPVSGGDSGAKAGTLSIMVGGDEADFEAIVPMFQAFGKSINYMGPAGCGQHTKAANQICVAGATAAYTEAIIMPRRWVWILRRCCRLSAAVPPAAGRSTIWHPELSTAITLPASSSSTSSRTCASSRARPLPRAWILRCWIPYWVCTRR